MTGVGVLLFLAGIGVLIFGILRHRKRNWPRRKTQIVIISSILAIIIGFGIIPSSDNEEASNEKPKQEEKTKKVNVKPVLKAETAFSTNDEGTIVIKGETNPGVEVALIFKDIPNEYTTADDNGAFTFSLDEFDEAKEAILSINVDGETKEQPLSLTLSPSYETKVAAKAEEERIAAEKAEAERVESERVAAEEKKAQEAKVAAEKKAAQERAATEKAKAAEAKRAAAAAQPDTSNKQGETVYITATGSKYHYSQDCRGLNNSNGETAVTVDEAKAQGFTLCGFE
ncbi:hypothetical protein C1903_13125 [Listeria ivanovii]|nr:hypothetical protein C1905_10530 [Listeria ivanovii]PZF92250.1 hypothetical protein C1903_13125 [Listeria ivanovii]PZG03418.1 hypothetical protein C2L88_13030 [Listeria ivanovii]PZG07628.1 hypothetical protein C1901_13075 [Listeria ivanovii]PZG25541.1 hypothetical protein C1900_10540 [Listeria ivanovii]